MEEKNQILLINALQTAGINLETIQLVPLDKLHPDPQVASQLRQVYKKSTAQCSSPLVDNPHCRHCDKKSRQILPVLQAHTQQLPEVVFVNDRKYSYFFACLDIEGKKDWKLISRLSDKPSQ